MDDVVFASLDPGQGQWIEITRVVELDCDASWLQTKDAVENHFKARMLNESIAPQRKILTPSLTSTPLTRNPRDPPPASIDGPPGVCMQSRDARIWLTSLRRLSAIVESFIGVHALSRRSSLAGTTTFLVPTTTFLVPTT